MKQLLITLLTMTPASLAMAHGVTEPAVSLHIKDQALAEVLKGIQQRGGIKFDIAPEVAGDTINIDLQKDNWQQILTDLLQNYSHVDILNEQGNLKQILITGRIHNGTNNVAHAVAAAPTKDNQPTAAEVMETSIVAANQLPDKYKAYDAGSVYALNLDTEKLKEAKQGDSVDIPLPDGHYQVTHDNRFVHDNGDITWVGYLQGHGNSYRMIATLGKNGIDGQVITPNAAYQLETTSGKNWLVDTNASGLQPVSLHGDDRSPAFSDNPLAMSAMNILDTEAFAAKANASTVRRSSTTATPGSAAGPTGSSYVITLMALTTSGFAGQTRLNQVIALANQAYIDSKINIQLQLVNTQAVSYPNSNSNSAALTDLTNAGNGNQVTGLANVKAVRDSSKADMVMLIRPFQPQTQQSCGVSWVNGRSANYAYSVVSDGQSGRSYCPTYTVAHELGHGMGAAHDRAHSNSPGAFSYCYGYGISGLFGTIMSYISPGVGKFSNPGVTCSGNTPCGTATEDNARCLNTTALTVSAFR